MLIARTAALGAIDVADSVDTWTAFRQGMLTNVLNPKVALFFLALMPQFIEPDSPTKVAAFLLLGLTFLTTGTACCLVLALGASRVRSYFDGRDAPFSWEPEDVEVLDSGTLAMNSGPVRDPKGVLIATFTSIWRLEDSGKWRIIFDKGNRVCPPQP